MIPAEDIIEWEFQIYGWFLENFGGFQDFLNTKLVLPTPADFPVQWKGDPESAEALFGIVKHYARMQDWPCRLEVLPDENDFIPSAKDFAEFDGSSHSNGPAGLFCVSPEDKEVVIAYAEYQLRNPIALIATFAHELGHYLLVGAKTKPPGGEDAYEPGTDMAATFMGFGVFLCNAAFSFDQFQGYSTQGWGASRLGYLGELNLSYALAIFVTLHDLSPDPIIAHLDLNPRAFFKDALKDLKRNRSKDLGRLRQIAAT
jgi:hypothetical protein